MSTFNMNNKATSMIKRLSAFSIALAGVSLVGNASAQPLDKTVVSNDYVIDPDSVKPAAKEGIEWRINAGATLNLSDNRSVLGQIDGTSMAFGFKFDAGLDWFDGPHELRNTLGIAAGVTRTAALPEFVKSQDAIDLESIYLYHFNDWLGAYARLNWHSQLFSGTDVRAAPVQYSVDGTLGAQDTRFRLTDPLLPSTFKESLGVFAQPIKEEPFNLEVRLGAGGQQILADGQKAVTDDAATEGIIEVITLADVLQLGAEGTLEMWGTFEDKKISYKVGAEAMVPFVTNDDQDRSPISLYNVLFKGDLSIKVVDWASLDYSIRVWRQEQLLQEWQMQNQLLLTMGLSAGSASEEKKE